MSVSKVVLLLVYAVLAALAISSSGSPAGVWSLRLILLLVVVHGIEVVVFFKACREAGGSLPAHLANVFLFGVLHMKDIKAAQDGS